MVSSGKALVDLTLEPEATAPARARQIVSERLGHHARCGDIVLCVSEAVTNAVLHARTRLRLVVWEDGPLIRVEVHDHDPHPPVPRAPDGRSPSGRGLLLIDQVASRWGVETTSRGKALWFEVAEP